MSEFTDALGNLDNERTLIEARGAAPGCGAVAIDLSPL
jgi:hypothetical protein